MMQRDPDRVSLCVGREWDRASSISAVQILQRGISIPGMCTAKFNLKVFAAGQNGFEHSFATCFTSLQFSVIKYDKM